jgi:hypothetical protein
MPDSFDPSPELQNVVFLEEDAIRQAESLIESCERCNPSAEIPFDWILDKLTGRDPSVTDYILAATAECPNCKQAVTEKTLVEPV